MATESFDTPLVIETKEEAERLLKAIEVAEAKSKTMPKHKDVDDPELLAFLKKAYNL